MAISGEKFHGGPLDGPYIYQRPKDPDNLELIVFYIGPYYFLQVSSACDLYRHWHTPRRWSGGSVLHDRQSDDCLIPQIWWILPGYWRSQGMFLCIFLEYTFRHPYKNWDGHSHKSIILHYCQLWKCWLLHFVQVFIIGEFQSFSHYVCICHYFPRKKTWTSTKLCVQKREVNLVLFFFYLISRT